MKVGYSSPNIKTDTNNKILNKGYFVFGFIFLIWWILFFIAIFVTKKGDWNEWVFSFTIASAVSFCCSLIWACVRLRTFKQTNHAGKKLFGDFFTRNWRKNKTKDLVNQPSQKDMEESKQNSWKMFYFTLSFFFLLVILSIIFTFSI